MGKRFGENYCDGSARLSLSVRKNGSVIARDSQTRFHQRTAISKNQFVPLTPNTMLRPRRVDSLDSYRLLKVIGIGAFGTVQLSQRIDDDLYCAIKIIERDPRTQTFETPELQILKNINHSFICSLLTNFIENDALHLVMEFCEAGDLHTHLSRTSHGFAKQQVTYFAASIVLAVEYLHERLYVHRDLKTENMMLTRDGHLKVIDFGLCKKLSSREEKMCDIVGTTTHLSAEIHRREPYGIEMDWWAVGVSLYQLRVSFSSLKFFLLNILNIVIFQTREQPFYGTREVEMQKNSRVREWAAFHDLLISVSCPSHFIHNFFV